MSHVPVGASLSPSVGTGQLASPPGGCTLILTALTHCSSPRLITQTNSRFSWEHPVALIRETHSPARIRLPTPSCFVCADVKNQVAKTVCYRTNTIFCALMLQNEQVRLACKPSHILPSYLTPTHIKK